MAAAPIRNGMWEGKGGRGGAGDSNYGLQSADIKKDYESTFTLRGCVYVCIYIIIHRFNRWLSI